MKGADQPLPSHVTTPLLTLVTLRSLDEDYAFVARQRASGTRSPRGDRRSALPTAIAVGVVGLLLAVAAVQSNRDAATDELGRATLISQIEVSRDELSSLQQRSAELSDSSRVAEQRVTDLQAQQREVNTVLRRLEVRTGYIPVRGPGVRISVANPPGADAFTEVRDEDLATLVDGLWQAGAEAISINGERLTALSGIRNTGRAVHVDGVPLTAPYTILAIGDPGSLQADLLATSQGAAWFMLVRSLGFEFSAVNAEELRLPAADLRTLRHVEPGVVGDDSGKKREESQP